MHHTILRVTIKVTPLSLLKSMAATTLIMPYYHVVSDEDIPHIRYLYAYKNIKQFTDDIDFLLKRYSPVDLKVFLRSILHHGDSQINGFLLTFDDGFREIYDVIAPVLLRKGIFAAFFLSTAFIDNKVLCYEHKASLIVCALENRISVSIERAIQRLYSNRGIYISDIRQAILKTNYDQSDLLDQVAELICIDFGEYLKMRKPYLTSTQIADLISKGFFIGAHSIDHPRYALLSEEEQLRQTVESVREVRKSFGIDYGVFAFPHSDASIPSKFLESIHQTKIVDATFGNQGMLGEVFPRHFQRFSLEKPVRSAREIIGKNYLRTIYKRLMGHGIVSRSL